jgi:phosphatidate cytidylyltransferase
MTAKPTGSELGTRIVSGIVMILVALAALWLGGIAFWLLVTAAALLMFDEWARLTGGSRKVTLFTHVVIFLVLAIVELHLIGWLSLPVSGRLFGYLGLMLGGIVVMLLAAAKVALVGRNARVGAGVLYAGVPALGLIVLRQEPAGLALAIWVMVVVWATDIGAYFAGRGIGGPKLAPRISPNKTWAGLIGGILAAGVCGALIAHFTALPLLFWWLGGVMAVMAQAGDLFESWLKRQAGVKDSGNILPGHGGVMDRLDGLVPVATLTALLVASGVG